MLVCCQFTRVVASSHIVGRRHREVTSWRRWQSWCRRTWDVNRPTITDAKSFRRDKRQCEDVGTAWQCDSWHSSTVGRCSWVSLSCKLESLRVELYVLWYVWTSDLTAVMIYSVSQTPFPRFFRHFSPNLVQVLHAYYMFPSTLDYEFLFNYLKLWRSYAILSVTTIISSKCPPSVETHTGWSHLIWHNFVTVGDDWIKICSLA